MSNLDELERLLEAAAPGPWHADHWFDTKPRRYLIADEDERHYIVHDLDRKSDAALIVAAVNNLPALVAAARRAEALENLLEKWADHYPGPLADRTRATLAGEGAPR